MLFLVCLGLALFLYYSMHRADKLAAVRSQGEAEKAALMCARASVKTERALNDYVAHEVRNPLSAALSAVSFVSAAVSVEEPLADEESQRQVREDVDIITRSLQFINDLLRSMLDMHRAVNKQMVLAKSPTDLRKDILEPVATMMYRRGEDYELLLDCPENLVISTDRLRLTQVVLNLARNSGKFVSKGFVRLTAQVKDGQVQLSVEDSGPGVPVDKHDMLFARFQESLDLLNQGTGMGLCLCKQLVDLMGGNIWLDDTYESGVKDLPGARFVVDTNTAPLDFDSVSLEEECQETGPEKTLLTKLSSVSVDNHVSGSQNDALPQTELPERLTVLIVDDDMVLRKLLSRSIKRVAPGWDVHEAASGEAALSLVDGKETSFFDLMFVDQYMASIEKRLLGTETVVALRARGVQSRICGLSANEMRIPFVNAGADLFVQKPIPTREDLLKAELLRCFSEDSRGRQEERQNGTNNSNNKNSDGEDHQ